MKLRRFAVTQWNGLSITPRVLLVSVAMLLLLPSAVFAQDVDVTPPQLVNLTFDPAIDVTAGAQSLTVTLELTDDLSGVDRAQVDFRSPSGGQVQIAFPFAPIGGDLWQQEVNFPEFSEAGAWTVANVFLHDVVGNVAVFNTADLAIMGFPTELTVFSVEDLSPPVLSSFDFSPNLIDVSAGDQPVTVTLELTDDPAGVDLAQVDFRSPSGEQVQIAFPFAPIGGDLWQQGVNIPQFSEAGTWTAAIVFLHDRAGNQAFFNTADLAAMSFPTELIVTAVPSDVLPPTLVSLDFQPTTIDTAVGPQQVTVDLELTDNLSGVDRAQVDFRSPSGAQVQIAFPFAPIGGNLWQQGVNFPQFSEDGTWKVERVWLCDVVGNQAFFNTADLPMGSRTDLVVIRPSLEVDDMIGPAGGTAMDDTFGPRAQIFLPPGAVAGLTDVAIDVFPDPLAIPMPVGVQGPGTLFVNINLDPAPSFPLLPPSPGMTLTLPTVNPMIAGTPVNLFRVDPATGMLVPAIDVSGMPVIGMVDPDGLSATFPGVASLSIVVGLLPSVLTPEAQIENLISGVKSLVEAGDLKARSGRVLIGTLRSAIRQLSRGREKAAAILLKAFVVAVKLLVFFRRLPAEPGNLLVEQATSIIDQLVP